MKYYVHFKRYYDSDESFPDRIDFVYDSDFRRGCDANLDDAYTTLSLNLCEFHDIFCDSPRSVYGILDITNVG